MSSTETLKSNPVGGTCKCCGREHRVFMPVVYGYCFDELCRTGVEPQGEWKAEHND